MRYSALLCHGAELSRRQHVGSPESGPAPLLPQELLSASQPQAATALTCVCEPLCFLCVCCVHPVARCARRYQKSLRELFFGSENTKKVSLYINGNCFFALQLFWLMKDFIGILCFQVVGEICI